MSRIWDSLKEVERCERGNDVADRVGIERHPVPDRRCTPRIWLYSPLLIYGHTPENGPFLEATEALHVNAGGGLITLTSAVGHGQMLILMNKVNEKEQICRVVSRRSSYLNRDAVVVGFPERVPDFWT